MLPTNFGRYKIESVLNHGGMSTVYLANDPIVNRKVAIKVLPKTKLNSQSAYSRFQREAQAVARLEHPMIVPVYDYGEHDEQPYIVMRYLSGGSLADWIKNKPLPISVIIGVLSRMVPALEVAHKAGIIHRDIKPSNILLDANGNAYLSDFGIIKLFDFSQTLTKDNQIIGTPVYMSPEQAQGEVDIDSRSDIYSLGVLLFEMLTGHPPFKGDTPTKILMSHIMQPLPALTDYRDDLDANWQSIINTAMAKDKNDRYPLVTDFLTDVTGQTDKTEAIPMNIDASTSTTQVYQLEPKPENGGAERRSLSYMLLGLVATALIAFAIFRFGLSPNSAENQPESPAIAQSTHTPAPATGTAPPTATMTAEPTVAASSTPAATFTPETESVLLADSTSTATVSPRKFIQVSLEKISVIDAPEINLDLPIGEHLFQDVPFDTGWKFSTHCTTNPVRYPTEAQLFTAFSDLKSIHFLIQGGQIKLSDEGKAIGNIRLEFDSGDSILEPLIAGFNIRDWHVDDGRFLEVASAEDRLQNAWIGPWNSAGDEGRIDMLTIDIPERLNQETLVSIELEDSSLATAGAIDPCLHLIALTIEQN